MKACLLRTPGRWMSAVLLFGIFLPSNPALGQGGCESPMRYSGLFTGDTRAEGQAYCDGAICGAFTIAGGAFFLGFLFNNQWDWFPLPGCPQDGNILRVTGLHTTFRSGNEILTTSNNRIEIVSGADSIIGYCQMGNYFTSMSNSISVVDANSRLDNNFLWMGVFGSHNKVSIRDGGHYRNLYDLRIGEEWSSQSNLLEVTGPGATVEEGEPTSRFLLGYQGSHNQLVVSNGGWITTRASTIGSFTNAAYNEARIVGTDSRWICQTNLVVGENGRDNRVGVWAGGNLHTAGGQLGFWPSASNNAATVDGNGSLWDCSGSLMVGVYAASNLLQTLNGGSVASDEGTVGTYSGAEGNVAQVSGTNSEWRIASNLYVGLEARGNEFTVEDGGLATCVSGILSHAASASHNRAIVRGADSMWSNSARLVIGRIGPGNELQISDGGTVVNSDGIVGDAFSSSGNVVRVTGAGSQWLNRGELMLGPGGGGNRLTIDAGGLVSNTFGTIGGYSDYNQVMVMDPSSLWWNEGLDVGFDTLGNSLTISNGGQVVSSISSIHFANTAMVSGAGSVWTSANLWVSGRLDVERGARMSSAGGALTGGRALISGADSVWSNTAALTVNGGLSVMDGAVVRSRSGGIGFDSGTNIVQIAGLDSAWLMATNFTVGFSAPARLDIFDRGYVHNAEGRIGNGAGTNRVSVSEGIWDLSGPLCVGYYEGPDNELLVSGGGQVSSQSGILARDYNSPGQRVTVTDSGSFWTMPGDLVVGQEGDGNTLVVSNSAMVTNFNSFVGALANSNSVVVAGAGSRWDTAGRCIVGEHGSGNQIWLLDGGQATGFDGTLGEEAIASNNLAVVSGGGASWSVSNSMSIGSKGRNNWLDMRAHASIRATDIDLGYDTGAVFNVLSVRGSGSVCTNLGSMIVGHSGGGNALNVLDGGIVLTTNAGIFGEMDSAASNQGLVSGTGSAWALGATLSIGAHGPQNSLVVSNGGQVLSSAATIGRNSVSNSVRVVGSNSMWALRETSALIVGESGSDNELVVSQGGVAAGTDATLGYFAGANRNRVRVQDPYSFWLNYGNLYVGFGGSQCHLIVTNQGWVTAEATWLGNTAEAWSNEVQVVGGYWSNRTDIVLGDEGSHNRVLISKGGRVWNSSTVVGQETPAISNLVSIADTGTLWQCAGSFNVGRAGRGNRLFVYNGSLLTSLDGVVGSSSDENRVMVAEQGSWGVAHDLVVGQDGSFNYLAIYSRGLVQAERVIVGQSETAHDNNVVISNGYLIATNSIRGGLVDVLRGLLWIQDGLLVADQLHATLATGQVQFDRGEIRTRNAFIANGQPFQVGDGTGTATLVLQGGNHVFTNGLYVAEDSVIVGDTGPRPGRRADEADVAQISGGIVTNRGILRAAPGGTLRFLSPVVNEGVVDALDGAVEFSGGLVNRGTVLDTNSIPRISQMSRSGANVVLSFAATSNASYLVETAATPMGGWTAYATNLTGSGGWLTITNPEPDGRMGVFRAILERP